MIWQDSVVTEPLACSLTGTDVPERLQAWRLVVATAKAVQRERPDQLRLALPADAAAAAVALCEAELLCCPFFRFTLELQAGGVSLIIAVPAEGAPLLDELVR